jgi:phosphoribosyl-ATP pyrophosphohydrolase
MSHVITYPRRRKSDRRKGSAYRPRSGSTRAAQEEFNEADIARAMLVALPLGSAPLDPESNSQRYGSSELDRLHVSLEGVTPESHPRTAKLLGAGTRKAAQKVIEEAGEVALEAVRHDAGGVMRESADLLYHLVVLWRRAGIAPADVWTEMGRRADAFGIAEKLPKVRHRESSAPRSDR